jgi:hypothetical protein
MIDREDAAGASPARRSIVTTVLGAMLWLWLGALGIVLVSLAAWAVVGSRLAAFEIESLLIGATAFALITVGTIGALAADALATTREA